MDDKIWVGIYARRSNLLDKVPFNTTCILPSLMHHDFYDKLNEIVNFREEKINANVYPPESNNFLGKWIHNLGISGEINDLKEFRRVIEYAKNHDELYKSIRRKNQDYTFLQARRCIHEEIKRMGIKNEYKKMMEWRNKNAAKELEIEAFPYNTIKNIFPQFLDINADPRFTSQLIPLSKIALLSSIVEGILRGFIEKNLKKLIQRTADVHGSVINYILRQLP